MPGLLRHPRTPPPGGKGPTLPRTTASRWSNRSFAFWKARASVDSGDIEACHTLRSKNKTIAPAIIIRFTNRKNQQAIIRQGRKLKGTDVYINENLTKKNADIARKARILRKQNKIQATWTSNCKVFIKLNGTTPESAKVLLVRDVTELDKFEV